MIFLKVEINYDYTIKDRTIPDAYHERSQQ